MKRAFNLLYFCYRDVVLLTTLALYLVVGVFNSSFLQNNYFIFIGLKICSGVCALIFCAYLLMDFVKGKFKITPFLIVSVVCALGVLIASHDACLCFLLALWYVFKDCEFNKILRVGSLALLFGLVSMILFAATGLVDNQIHSRGETPRMTFGFSSAVTISLWLFCFCAAYNFYRKEKITIWELLLEFGINGLIYYFTDTRGGFVLVLAVIFGSFCIKALNIKSVKTAILVKKFNNWWNKRWVHKTLGLFFISLPILIFLIFGILVHLYGKQISWVVKINELLSGRLKLTYNAFHERSITPFGGRHDWFHNNGNYIGVDTAFYHYLFNNGVVGVSFVLIITMLICYKNFHEKKYFLCFILTLFLIDSFIDSLFYNVHYNLFLLSMVDGVTYREIMFGKEQKNANRKTSQAVIIEEQKMLQHVKLSIIVPVHNGEKFIKKTINKLLQVKLNKELIVINDCSTDSSLKILQTYYDQIILINLKENHGVSYARNLGLQKATGNYVTFIDIDDDFEIDMHGKILAKMLQEQASVGICKNDIINEDGKLLDSGKDVDFGVLNQEMVIKYYLCNIIVPAVWNSVYDATLAKSVRFEEQLKIGEDILYPLQVLLKAQKTCFVNETLYHYIQHPTSAMHELSDKLLGYLKVTDYLTNGEKEKLTKLFPEEFNYFKLEMVKRTVNSISLIAKGNKSKAANMLKSFLTKDTCLAIIKNEHSPRYIKFEFLVLKIFGINIHLFVFPVYALLKTVLRR